MQRFFKSKIFIILLIIALVLTIVPSMLSLMGYTGYVRNAVGVVLTPLRLGAEYVSRGIEGFADYFSEYDRLSEENQRLSLQLKEQSDKVYAAEILDEENLWLRSYLGLKREHTDYEFIDALVMGREAGSYITVFSINRGSIHGIVENMPVITSDGAVGFVVEVGLNWSKVSTILSTSTSIGGYVERSGATGLVEGSYELKNKGCCKMDYLSADTDIKVGDKIFSSGIGSVYPQGLYIGRVESVSLDEYGRNLVAAIKPDVDLSKLSRVMVIASFSKSMH